VDIDINEPDPTVLCATDSVLTVVSASGGEGPYTYTWNDANNQVGDTAYLPTVQGSMTGVTEFIVTATDACGYTGTDTVTITLNQTLEVDSIISQDASACLPDGWASATVTGVTSTGGQPFYNWTGPGNPGQFSVDGSVITDIPSGWYYFTVIDDVCSAQDSVFIDIQNPPIAQFSATPTAGCSPLQVSITNTSQNTTNYAWDFGNGQTANVTDMNPINQTYVVDGIITLIASDASGCADTTSVAIVVTPCGCTDPEATNYDPNALQDDGSCIYPIPTISAPNVITPNGDNTNDIFFLDAVNTTSIYLVITNRWGNLIYEGEGPNPAWDGKNQAGQDVEDGVYFYRYEATGTADQKVEGHGFVHVER
jgi:gliding motility-associated-like protein